MLMILEPGRLRQEDREFQVRLGYIVRSCLKTNKPIQKSKKKKKKSRGGRPISKA
jgi:hypothetical protein